MKQPSPGPARNPAVPQAAETERRARLAALHWAQLKQLAA